MKQRIKVNGRNIGDLWRLPCVIMATKTAGKFRICVTNHPDNPSLYDGFTADEGDWLCQDESGMWYVDRKEEGGEP